MATETHDLSRGRVVNYDVFISHRGPDVKQTLVNHLDESLRTAGIHAFVDYKELREGEAIAAAITDAIHNTRLHIPVFSKDFAASRWCLDELCEMFKTNAKIMPLFYDVAPADVRRPDKSGSPYAPAFSNHTESGRYSPEQIEEWKKALRKVSEISGWCLSDCNGFEATLVKRVVSKVLDELNIVPLDVAKHPVGLKERTDEMIERLQLGMGSAVRTVGILGMGGLGKTTLAKSIFNNLYMRFEAASFLFDVRQKSKAKYGLVDLQKQLLKDLLKIEWSISGTDHGKSILRKRLVGTSVLIVLDDVDDSSQVDALQLKNFLGAGSRIIATSRDRHILHLAESDDIYDMPALTNEHSQQLFYWHSFLRAYAPFELRNLAEKIVEASQGHPLAIEVIGAHLYGRSAVNIWEETLEKLANQPFEEITSRLQISYDALKAQDQLMFLDIACFLIGKHEVTAIRIWQGCSWKAVRTSLENLKDKSLIKVDREARITMHDHLRDMGWEIVASKALQPYQLGERTHLWNSEDAQSVLKKKKGTNKVRGLLLTSNPDKMWTAESFVNMNELQLLVLSNTSINGDFGVMSGELRWFQWQFCQLNCLPSQLSLEHVTVLDLKGSNIEVLWEHNSDFKVPFALRELNLSGCKSLVRLPELSDLSELQQIDLKDCASIKEIPDSIGSLTNLEYLDLSDCKELQVLPQAFGNLRRLTKLFLSRCPLLTKLPDTIGQLATLKELWLEESSLAELPLSFGELSSLVGLYLAKSFKLLYLPSTIGGLRNLMYLHMSECTSISKIPEEADKLTSLAELRLDRCKKLSELPEQMGNLRKLRILLLHHNPSLTKLPASMTNLKALIILEMGDCNLDKLPDEFGNLSSLETLMMQYNQISKLPTSFQQLPMLVNLELHHCKHLYKVKYLPRTLRRLEIGDCPELQMLSGLSFLENLEFLVLCNCVRLTELLGVESLNHLLELNISGCTNLKHVPGLEKLKSLRRLFLAGSGIPVEDSGRWIKELLSLEQTSVYADNLPECFSDSINQQVIAEEHARRMCLEQQVPESCEPCLAVLFGFISHDQGWSDYEWDHGRYNGYTFVEAGIVRGDQIIALETLLVNRHADSRSQLHVCIYRASHPFLANLRGGDKIRIWARSIYQAWRITVKEGAIRLVYTEEDLQATLGILANELRCTYTGSPDVLRITISFIMPSSQQDIVIQNVGQISIIPIQGQPQTPASHEQPIGTLTLPSPFEDPEQ